jgi:hypothetical protein
MRASRRSRWARRVDGLRGAIALTNRSLPRRRPSSGFCHRGGRRSWNDSRTVDSSAGYVVEGSRTRRSWRADPAGRGRRRPRLPYRASVPRPVPPVRNDGLPFASAHCVPASRTSRTHLSFLREVTVAPRRLATPSGGGGAAPPRGQMHTGGTLGPIAWPSFGGTASGSPIEAVSRAWQVPSRCPGGSARPSDIWRGHRQAA